MGTTYYRLESDLEINGRWYLNGLEDSRGQALDPRGFVRGIPADIGPPLKVKRRDRAEIVEATLPLRIGMRREGFPLEWTLADFAMPVVTTRAADVVSSIAGNDIQRIPVEVLRRHEDYAIINVVRRVACIDRDRSELEWWGEEDDWPEMIGKLKMVARLAIDPELTNGAHILRPEGWEVAMIVSDVVRSALENAGVTGVRFREV